MAAYGDTIWAHLNNIGVPLMEGSYSIRIKGPKYGEYRSGYTNAVALGLFTRNV